jgi:hypothetical protein
MAQGEMWSIGRDVTVVRETGRHIALPPPTKASYVLVFCNVTWENSSFLRNLQNGVILAHSIVNLSLTLLFFPFNFAAAAVTPRATPSMGGSFSLFTAA